MSSLMRMVWGMAVAAALALSVWADGLVVCRACGREAKPGEKVCSHCSSPLPQPKTADAAVSRPAEAVEDRGAAVARLARGVVEDSLRQARELESERPAVALSYYQNALALLRLIDPAKLPAGASAAVVAGNEKVMRALLIGKMPCRTCNGSGKYQMDLGRVMQKRGGVLVGDGVPCPACKGSGSYTGYRDVAKVKMEILQGREEFERRQMAAGDVRVGRALVPPALDQALDNRGRALVMTGMPAPCSACQLTGRQKCTGCKGTGWVACTYEGCSNGKIEEKKSSSTRPSKRLNDEEVKKCPKCGGLGEVPCPACKGNGSVACTKCDGSGKAPRCNRCTGTGLMACSKCKGTGELKGEPCPECKGEKVSLCTTCRGEGALAR